MPRLTYIRQQTINKKSQNKTIAAHAAEANAQGERAARQQFRRYGQVHEIDKTA